MAHRGGVKTPGNLDIENSLTSFRHAYDAGFRYLETDVRLSADGVVFAIHDETLERLTGTAAAVHDLDAAELDRQLVDGREPLLRMSTLFEAFGDVKLNIDVKSDDVVVPMCRLIEAHGATARVCLGSFSHRRVAQARKMLPDLATSASWVEVAWLRLAPGWLVRKWRPRAACVQVPVRRGPLTIITPSLLERSRHLGLQVHAWTVDDAAEMHRLLDLGVDGIVTDRTDVLKDVLVSRGTWKEPR